MIVGKRSHNTPIFRDKISYVVLNPYWKVPDGIVKREIIPKMVRNPNYLKREGLEIHTTWYERSPRVNPYSIYWESYYYGHEKFPYRIMQPPGPKNALGKIKFKFSQIDFMYICTILPNKGDFLRRIREAFFSRCVRGIQKPIELFEHIAKINGIDIKEGKENLKGKRKVQFNLDKKIPVFYIS